jgi:hypothetical protein
MTIQQHKNYLKFTALVIGAFGPIFFLGTISSLSEPARWTLDFLSLPLDQAQTYSDPTTRFLSALTGGFLFGWGICVWFLQQWVFDSNPNGVRKSVLAGLCAWFVLDSLGSFASGNVSNVFFNVIVLLLAVGPLWFPASIPVK